MERFDLQPSNVRLSVHLDAGSTLTNAGPGTVSYADSETDAATGSLTTGSSVVLAGGTWYLWADARAAVHVIQAAETPLDERVAAVEGSVGAAVLGQPINVAQQAGADNAAKLTAAIAALPATGAWLHIPRGQYTGSWTITGKDHLTVTGEGSSSVIHNTTASPADALRFVDCDELKVSALRVQGTSGTRDGLHLENCQRASVGGIFCQGSGRYGIYAQKCFGIMVEPCFVGIDTQSPYPTSVANCLTGLYLGWDGSAADSGCNQFVVNGGFYVVGKSQDTAIVIDHADGGVINSPIPELSQGGIRIVDSVAVTVTGYYGEANPSDIEYATGTATVTNGSTAVTGSGTAWNTADGEGNINAYPGKWVIVGTSWARIDSVASNTALTLEVVWPGSTAAGTAYRIQSVDLHLKNSHQCNIAGGRGGGAVLLENSSRNIVNTVTESIFFDATSNYNEGRVVTNRASSAATRLVDNGTGNRFTQLNYQTNARVKGGHSLLVDPVLQAHEGLHTFTAGAFSDPAPGVTLCMKVNTGMGLDYLYGLEQSDPTTPPSDVGVLYFKDVAGATRPVYKNSSGTVTVFSGQPEPVNVVTTSGSAQTIPDPATTPNSLITLTTTCTLTFPAAAAGKSFTLALKQDATGSRTVVWPSAAKWPSATAPTLSTGANKVDMFTFVCLDGTIWMSMTAGIDFR